MPSLTCSDLQLSKTSFLHCRALEENQFVSINAGPMRWPLTSRRLRYCFISSMPESSRDACENDICLAFNEAEAINTEKACVEHFSVDSCAHSHSFVPSTDVCGS